MSLFIGLKGEPEALILAKTGVLSASLIAGVAGYLRLRMVSEEAPTVRAAA